MKAVLQRVSHASVAIYGETVGKIDKGLLVLLGVAAEDSEEQVKYLSAKIANLRIFEDEEGKMNRSVIDIGGGVLVVPNFTLCANAKKGNRPSYTGSAEPKIANDLYEYFCDKIDELNIKVEKGVFGGDMKVSILNDGPVTIVLDTNEIMPTPK